ncbi:MAG: hypothetical protein K0R41_4112, partial [Geminicoccaceae bacterium]|nr:hypothetical protein [Geminicoccaceae bacterium]
MMKLAAIWPRTRSIGTPDGCGELNPLAAWPGRSQTRNRLEPDLREIVVGAAGKRGVHGALHGAAGRPFVDELDLGFGGVDVDV